MAEILRLVVVEPDGSAGAHLGSLIRQKDGKVDSTASVLDDLVRARRRVTGWPIGQIFDHLASEGWSNGHVMLVKG